jgi:alanine racemase
MAVSRRSFLGSGAALPLADLRVWRPADDIPPSSFDPWVEVHGGHLRRNVEAVHRRVGGRPVMAVVKNDGYGTGIANVGRVLDGLPPVAGMAVVKLHEAVTLRDAGIRKPVLLMGPFDERNLADAVARSVTCMVYTPIGDALERVAARLQKPVDVHVCVDTGIGRVGVPVPRAAALIRDLAARRGVRIAGTMMTFTEDAEFDREQLRRFRELCAGLVSEGVSLGPLHAASSYGLFQHPDAFLDMVRPGMALYGIYPEPEFRRAGVMDLVPALSLKARVVYVKRLAEGESAGYNRAYVAARDVWVATLPVGHADGWPRTAARGASVRIGGALYPIVASVSASHTIVEIGDEARVAIGDVATFFDWTDGSRPEDVGAACGASVYDLTMHLNPLLPRRLV